MQGFSHLPALSHYMSRVPQRAFPPASALCLSVCTRGTSDPTYRSSAEHWSPSPAYISPQLQPEKSTHTHTRACTETILRTRPITRHNSLKCFVDKRQNVPKMVMKKQLTHTQFTITVFRRKNYRWWLVFWTFLHLIVLQFQDTVSLPLLLTLLNTVMEQ